MIPFNNIYSIAHERDNEINQALKSSYGQSIQQPESRRTVANLLHRLFGSRRTPANAL